MVIAALISFGILLVAWILAPDKGSPRRPAAAVHEPEALPLTI
ncbi:MAG: hypothetical protein ABIZ57_02485 [Candidatus Limnocylindria bacterium]